MLTRHIGRADHIPGTGVDQRPQARVGADDVVVAECGVQRGVDGVEQERDLRGRRLRDVGNRSWGILVGQPQVYPAELFGHREHEPVDLTRDRNRQRRSRIAERCGVEHQVGPAAGPQPDGVVDLARPDSRGVDDGAGGDVRRLPGEHVGQRDRGPRRVRCRHAGEDPGAVLRGGAGHRGDQTGVVDELPVIGQQRAVEAVAAHGRRQRDGASRVDPPRPGQRRRRRARQPAQPVAGREPESHQRPRRRGHLGEQRNQLRHRVYQMRGVAGHQDSAFDGAAPGDADIAGGQIAQPAVDQLRAPPAGAERQIVLLHQRDRQSPGRGVQGDAGAGDAAADDDDVERSRRRPERAEFGARAGMRSKPLSCSWLQVSVQ